MNPHRGSISMTAMLAGGAAAVSGVAALNAWFQVPSERVALDAARTLASTSADPTGALLPLFVHVRDALWLQPIPVYLMALALKLSGGANAGPALVTAAVAALDVALTYLVALHVFGRSRPAAIAAALLVLTPAHLVYGSTASPALYSVPFVLLWLLAWLPAPDETRGPRLFAAMAALGLGVYTNPEAVWTMTAYAALALILLAREDSGRGTRTICAAAGFIAPLLPLVPWYLVHPHSYLDTMGRWAVHPAYIRNPIEGLGTFFRYDVFARHLSLYWDFFSPRHLFFEPLAPGLAWIGGVLPWPMLLFLPLGLYHLGFREHRPAEASRYGPAILWGFFIAPIASAAFDEQRSIAGAVALLPFAAILGAAGIETTLDLRRARALTASEKRQTPELR